MAEVKDEIKNELHLDGKVIPFDVLTGTEGEKAIDIRALRKETGYITYDPGYGNTGACQSAITFVDGENGILRYRGYPIEDLANQCTFVEVSYLLIHGELPTTDELHRFSRLLNKHSMIHEGMRQFFRNYPDGAHPMAILSAMVVSLSTFYPEVEDGEEELDVTVARLLSKLRTIAAFSYKQSVGERFVQPSSKLTYCENFLRMMFNSPVDEYELDRDIVAAVNKILILHADHEQNCSTSAVRMVGSAGANLYASISAGICALWGPLHGGANQAVIEMLEDIQQQGGDVSKAVLRAKDKDDSFRLMGFGHRVYKTYDPRAKIAKVACESVLKKLGVKDPLLDIAMQLEECALNDEYFKERNLYPNVDYYTGIMMRAIGFPTEMFPVIFAIGRMPGWIAQWRELMTIDPDRRIGRPRQIYTGENNRAFVPLDKRG